MSQSRKRYTREFKLEAIQLAKTSGKPKAQVEREPGLSPNMLPPPGLRLAPRIPLIPPSEWPLSAVPN